MSNKIVLTLAVTLLAGTAAADDGQIEINQTCAVQTGCFAGDAAGFPVSISSPGSYLLTSGLDLTATPATRAIEVAGSASPATVDLNGFEIRGAAPDCTGSGPTLACSPDVGAHGISATLVELVTVRSGSVRNMQGSGVVVGAMSRVEDVSTLFNSGDGIQAGQQSLTNDCIAFRNGEDGLQIANGSVLSDSAATSNGQFGVNAFGDSTVRGTTSRGNPAGAFNRTGRLSQEANACDDGTCSRRDERSFYLTLEGHTGATPLTACDAGFHMASFWELRNVTELRYDATRGPDFVSLGHDLSSGPPGQDGGIGAVGWVRTGHESLPGPQVAGRSSCFLWTSVDPGIVGTAVGLGGIWNSPAEHVAPWISDVATCNTQLRVWCVED